MTELVYINNNHALTSSLLVAEKFCKEHKHVLEAIQQITKMFALVEVEQPMPVGGGVKKMEQKFSTPDGEVRVSIKTIVYQKGVDFIRKTLKGMGYKEVETNE